MDENKTTRTIPDNETDRTIVIPRDTSGSAPASHAAENNEDRTIVIPHDRPAPDSAAAPHAEKPKDRTVTVTSGWTRHSILGDLAQFLFPHQRTVVDETMELLRSGDGKEEDEAEETMPEFTEHLADVKERYDVADKPFAEGGQGRIHKAVDRALGCEIAMKSLHDRLCTDSHARDDFLNEAKLTASLDHPAIIPIHGLFGDGGNGMHLAMKLISGHTLSAYLKNIVKIYEDKGIRRFDEARSLRNRLEIFLKVCEALEYAHARKIIHRDLKLENIMIGKHRETYVTDWGLALHVKDAENLKKINGTPGFIAPEVLTTHKADTRSDIYSLGIILFELVTLSPAFSDTDLAALLNRVKAGKHAPLRHRFGCRIDADLKAIIRKAIAVDPERRYQTVGDFSEDIRRYLTNRETIANPDHLFGKICRWGVNHRRGMLLATMTVLLLGIASVARMLHKEILWTQERRVRDHAVGTAYGNVVVTTNRLENRLNDIETRLEQLRLNMLFSNLKVKTPNQDGWKLFVPLETYRDAPPASYQYAKSYGHPIDPNGICAINFLTKRPVVPEELKYFSNTATYMREAALNTRRTAIPEKDAEAKLLKEGSPVRKVYFALADGTFALYPGSTADFPPGYHPPSRPWYEQAMKGAGHIVWCGPYEDSGVHKEQMLTCAVRIDSADRKYIGIAAVDFSLTMLAQQLLDPADDSAKYVLEKMLIDPSGKVIFRMVPPERNTKPFSDDELIRRMLKKKFGTLLTQKDGREVLLAFAYVDSINVLYVESLDMASLVARQRLLGDEE